MRWIGFALLCLAVPASAQFVQQGNKPVGVDGGFQGGLPDPRQRSRISRPPDQSRRQTLSGATSPWRAMGTWVVPEQ